MRGCEPGSVDGTSTAFSPPCFVLVNLQWITIARGRIKVVHHPFGGRVVEFRAPNERKRDKESRSREKEEETRT